MSLKFGINPAERVSLYERQFIQEMYFNSYPARKLNSVVPFSMTFTVTWNGAQNSQLNSLYGWFTVYIPAGNESYLSRYDGSNNLITIPFAAGANDAVFTYYGACDLIDLYGPCKVDFTGWKIDSQLVAAYVPPPVDIYRVYHKLITQNVALPVTAVSNCYANPQFVEIIDTSLPASYRIGVPKWRSDATFIPDVFNVVGCGASVTYDSTDVNANYYIVTVSAYTQINPELLIIPQNVNWVNIMQTDFVYASNSYFSEFFATPAGGWLTQVNLGSAVNYFMWNGGATSGNINQQASTMYVIYAQEITSFQTFESLKDLFFLEINGFFSKLNYIDLNTCAMIYQSMYLEILNGLNPAAAGVGNFNFTPPNPPGAACLARIGVLQAGGWTISHD